MKLINARELKRMYDTGGPARTTAHLTEALEKGHLKPESFSIRDLFVSLVEGGDELLNLMSFRKSGGMRLQEAAGSVDTSAFSNISGQIFFNKIREEYMSPQFLWPELCETMTSDILDNERIAGIGGVGDKAEAVDEAQPYPEVGVSEEYIDLPPSVKRGFIVPVTREAVVNDRTGILLKRCADTGKWLGINKEKRVLDVATGVVNTYKRNGTASNTYLTAGAYINQSANTLVDYTDVENAWLLLDAIIDPNTGEPVLPAPNTLLVPSALAMTALRILQSTEVAAVDNSAAANTIRTWFPNPIPARLGQIKLLSSPYVKARTGSASTWFFGDFKSALIYRSIWDLETLQASSNSEQEFQRDIVARFRCSERGSAGVMEPRFLTKNT